MNSFNSTNSMINTGKLSRKNKWFKITGMPTNVPINAIYVLDLSHVYIGASGTITNSPNYFGMYDGNTITSYVATNIVKIHAIDPSHVYIVGGVNFSMWNGTNISILSSLGQYRSLYALDLAHVYIGGTSKVLMWNGTSLQTIVSTTTTTGSIQSTNQDYTYAIYAIDATHVYIGGGWSQSSYNQAPTGMWNGSSFIQIGSNGSAVISSLSAVKSIHAIDNEHVYFGSDRGELAMWNGSTNSWTLLYDNISSTDSINAICAIDPTHIYFGDGNVIQMWDGTTAVRLTTYSTISSSLTMCYAISAFNSTNIFCGGRMTSFLDISSNYIARWGL